jgi:hypothetical protein
MNFVKFGFSVADSDVRPVASVPAAQPTDKGAAIIALRDCTKCGFMGTWLAKRKEAELVQLLDQVDACA